MQPHRHAHLLVEYVLLPFLERVVDVDGPFPIRYCFVFHKDAHRAIEQNVDPPTAVAVVLYAFALLDFFELERHGNFSEAARIDLCVAVNEGCRLDYFRNCLHFFLGSRIWVLLDNVHHVILFEQSRHPPLQILLYILGQRRRGFRIAKALREVVGIFVWRVEHLCLHRIGHFLPINDHHMLLGRGLPETPRLQFLLLL